MRRGRGLLISGAVALVLSLAVFGLAAWVFVSSVRDGVEAIAHSPTMTVHERPGAGDAVDLKRGSYIVYESAETDVITIYAVTVRGPGGAPVPVRVDRDQTMTSNSTRYRSAATFTVPADGHYTVVVTGEEGAEAVIGPGIARLFGLFGGVFSALGLGAVGAVVFLAGAGLLIGGAVVSTRSPQAVPPAAAWPGGPPHHPQR